MIRTTILLTLTLSLLAGCGTPATPNPVATASPMLPPTATALPTQTPLPSPVPDTLFVDPSVSLGPISPLVYGSNYGPWLTVPFYMLPQAYASGITILRFPGGAYGDHNNVTPRQIDQFMDFARQMGATAIFSVRLLDGTPEQAAEMVRYTNIEKKYGVQYWNIGNEPTLYNAELKNRGETYDVKRLNKEWRAFAEAMKKVDPTVQLVGPEMNQFSFDIAGTNNYDKTVALDSNGLFWIDEFLKANGDLVDIVSFHRYPFPRTHVSGPPSIDELRQNVYEWDKIIVRMRELIHKHTGRDLPIAITEFNSAYDKSTGGEATPDSHYNAIWLADVLGRMIRNDVFMANQFAFAGRAGVGSWGLIGGLEVYPSYYTYQLYKKFGNELVYSSSDEPDLSVYAAIREDGVLTIIVINLSLEAKEKHIQIGSREQAQAGAWLFDPTHNVEPMGGLSLDQDIILAPQSVLFLEVDQDR